MTSAELRAIAPEFAKAPEAAVAEAVAQATAYVNAALFGTDTEMAIRLRACHTLALGPYGQQARLISKDGTTTYQKQFDDLLATATAGEGRVAQ